MSTVRKITLTVLMLGICNSAGAKYQSQNEAFETHSLNELSQQASDNGSAERHKYWSGTRVSRDSTPDEYITDMHRKFSSIKANYEFGGIYYYRDGMNSFGQREAVNTQEEVIFCSASDRTFTQTMKQSLANTTPSDVVDTRYDATSFGRPLGEVEDQIRQTLVNNSNPSTKGRFCYKVNNTNVKYKTVGANDAVYCAKDTLIPEYTDPVSEKTCRLRLDINLKMDEVRFLRQLQSSTNLTIAQGYVRCERNFNGSPVLRLVANGEGCSPTDRRNCNYSCDWAHNVVCAGATMPSWGGGKCKANPTTIFMGESVTANSSYQLSYKDTNGYWSGSAQMSCNMVSDSPTWVVVSQTCTKTTTGDGNSDG